MTVQITRNVNFGAGKSNLTGSSGVGFAILNSDNSVATARTTNGVYQVATGSGIYGAFITFSSSFNGHILWDTGGGSPTYAIEEYNYQSNNPNVDTIYNTLLLVSSSVDFVKKIDAGRWFITNNQMIFFDSDNSTEVARFNLFDNAGNPTMTGSFERRRV